MNWDAAAGLAEIIGAIAVVISLIYLAIQIRQNTRIVAATTFQSISSTSSDITMRMAESPQLAAVMVKMLSDPDELSPEELMQMQLLLRAAFRNFENYFYQFERGYLEEDMWGGYRQTMVNQIASSVGAAWWKNHQVAFGKKFVDFVNAEIKARKATEDPWTETQRDRIQSDA